MFNLTIKQNNKNITIPFESSVNLSHLLLENNIYIDRPCGGNGTCGKCKVRFVDDAPLASSYDKSELTGSELNDGYRLACKCVLENDAYIEIIEKQNMAIQVKGIEQNNDVYYEDDTLKDYYGIAVDLGTTTIVAYLIKLYDGNTIDTTSQINPQRKYGDNVITRSEYINSNKDGLYTLQNLALDAINSLINKLCNKNNINSNMIKRAVISGNTIMEHILCGVNPFQITLAPYTPVFTEQKKINAKEFGLNINTDGNVYITNSISGYIGGDIAAGIIAVDLVDKSKTALLVDIGTNGEIVLSNKDKMYACSVAAGPAFEGEHIQFGLGGVVGAINKAYASNDMLKTETIGNTKPIGICGSGLLDIASYLLDKNIIDEMGTMNAEVCKTIDDEIVYYVADDIYISQKDIREIQLAKSAVASGIEVLIQKAGITHDYIDIVYLAGGFGSYLNVESAAKIGLINKALKDKCISAGNTAGMGSIKALLSDKVLQSLDALTEQVEYIELSLDKTFNDLFIDNMMF